MTSKVEETPAPDRAEQARVLAQREAALLRELEQTRFEFNAVVNGVAAVTFEMHGAGGGKNSFSYAPSAVAPAVPPAGSTLKSLILGLMAPGQSRRWVDICQALEAQGAETTRSSVGSMLVHLVRQGLLMRPPGTRGIYQLAEAKPARKARKAKKAKRS